MITQNSFSKIPPPAIGLIGSSGYAYALVGMHLANLVVNWNNVEEDHVRLVEWMPNNILRLIWIIIFVIINIWPLLTGGKLAVVDAE